MKLQRSMQRCLLSIAAILCGGCHSLPQPTTTWRGYEEGRVKVSLVLTDRSLPAKAWLVESQREGASGLVSYTKWGAGDFRFSHRAYFTLEESWRPGIDHIGIIEGQEFCTVNPEHGGFEEGDSFVITNTYDYCARLVQD